MQHAYNELYLNKASTSLAIMLDHAVNDLRLNPDRFFDLFMASGVADLLGHGHVRIIAGMSGIELTYHVLVVSGIDIERASYRYTSGRSAEYWTGWALAQYQWERSIPFEEMIRVMPLRDIISMISGYRDSEIETLSEGLSWMDTLKVPDHMNAANYSEFAARFDDILHANEMPTSLKTFRIRNGFSQSQLAAVSGVPVRTIQQYEQRQKDINKASFEHVMKLAAALSCEPIDLTERR